MVIGLPVNPWSTSTPTRDPSWKKGSAPGITSGSVTGNSSQLAPPRVGRRGPVGISDDAVHRAGRHALAATGTQLGDDLHGERTPQHCTEGGRACLDAGVAVDAVRALHAVRREPPARVPSTGTNASRSPHSQHRSTGYVALRMAPTADRFPFLSDEWIAEARRIHESYRGKVDTKPPEVQVNLTVRDVPFGSGTIDAHLDTLTGELEVDLGHLPDARVKLTLDYVTAASVILDPQSAMSAFFGGRIKVDGDFATIIILQGVM